MNRTILTLGALGAAFASPLVLAACSSSSASPPETTMDATSPEASADDASSVDEADAADATDAADAADAADGNDGAAVSDGSVDAMSDAAMCIPVDAGTSDPDAAATGSTLAHTTFKCTNCHGDGFNGGFMVAGAYSKNLTPDPGTGLGCWTDSQIVTAILYGTTPDGETLCVMPRWITKGMSPDQAEDIVEYLRSLAPVVNQVQPTVCPASDGGAGDGGAGDGGDAQPTDGSNGG